MFTECPECETTFRLSAEDLRRAQGKVRCGECGAVFNALESLAEDTAGDAESGPASSPLPGPEPDWLTDSSNNPPGDLEPDLDAYEAEGYLDTADEPEAIDAEQPADDSTTEYEFDEEDDDDSGIILYLEPDEPLATADSGPTPGTASLEDPDTDGSSAADDELVDGAWGVGLVGGGTADDADEADQDDFADLMDDPPDFDESIWERIPGVGAEADANETAAPGTDDAADWLSEDSGIVADATADAREDWQVESSAPADQSALDEDQLRDEGDADPQPADDALRATAWPLKTEASDPPPDLATDSSAALDDAMDEPPGDATDTEADDEPADRITTATTAAVDDELEFDVPAEKWNAFFGPMPENSGASVWQPPSLEAAEADDAEADAVSTAAVDAESGTELSGDADGMPSWHGRGAATADDEMPPRRTGLMLFGGVVLAVLFALQLVHYNRDDLATHPSYGAWVRDVYAALDQPLYPTWSLQNNYEIRGSEAVAGESGQDVLDIRAQIAAVGAQPTGLPRLRVVLRDRWSNPVAASDFSAADYAQAEDLPADGLLAPGAVIAAHVSILDPGSGAQGFELELCLPRRGTGLECTDQPFK